MIAFEPTTFRGWTDAVRMGNGQVELVAVADIGPRILSFGFSGGENLLFVREEFAGQRGGDTWRNYGGHRLWIAPEDVTRTYVPDNAPGELFRDGDALLLLSPPESRTGIRKSVRVTMDPTTPRVHLSHRIENCGARDIECAPWALTVMAPGGTGVCPLPTKSHPDGFLPNRPFALWPYSDFSDGRYQIGRRAVLLHQRSGFEEARMKAKIGLACPAGWCAYTHPEGLLVKRFEHEEGAVYPDFGCSVEMFTNNLMFELETLGPIRRVPPGSALTHHETWELHEAGGPLADENSVDKHTVLGALLR